MVQEMALSNPHLEFSLLTSRVTSAIMDVNRTRCLVYCFKSPGHLFFFITLPFIIAFDSTRNNNLVK